MDAEKGEGPDLTSRFRIPGFPSMVFLTGDGEEIDRILGYLPPVQFLEELKRIMSGNNTFMSLKEVVVNDPGNGEAILILAEKYGNMNKPEYALTLWYKLRDLKSAEYMEQAEYMISSIEGNRDESAVKLLSFMESNKNSTYYDDALLSAMRIFKKTGAKVNEVKLYREFVDIKEKAGEVTYSLLNGYAWRMTELELDLDNALEKALVAVELVKSEDEETRAQVIDTLAEVYWKLGNTRKAIDTIKKAIALQPEDTYYQDQLKKFST